MKFDISQKAHTGSLLRNDIEKFGAVLYAYLFYWRRDCFELPNFGGQQ